jgi:hypothetical protein
VGFLDRFRRKYRRVEDPTFGELTYEPPWWRGKVLFRPCSSEVAINIEADEHGPTEQQRNLFRELDRRYQGLLPQIGAALWDLYRPVREELDRDARLGPSDSSGMAEHTELFGSASGRIAGSSSATALTATWAGTTRCSTSRSRDGLPARSASMIER